MTATDRPNAPNVIVFFTDQQRWDTAGVHGNPAGLTPNFDRMAMAGTHLYHSFTCQPVCGPARSCLQTGRYATETGVWKNGGALPAGMPTLAGLFGAAGYRTGYIGKWHLGTAGSGPVPPEQRGGYRDWLASNTLEFTSDAYRTRMFDAGGNAVDLPGYRVDALADAAIRYVDARAREPEPFFLFVSFIEPHHQNHRDDYPAPSGYEERYTGAWTPPDLQALGGSSARHLAGYYGMVKRLDEALGRLQDALYSLDLAQSTVLLYTSDHGCHFKTRNGEYKRSCHESSIRLPTALSGPGFDGGGRVQELTSLIDLPRTLLDAAGVAAPDAMRGRSVLPLLTDPDARAAWPADVFVQISESQVARAVRTARWKYGVTAPDIGGGKQPAADCYEEQYLYDLHADRYELHNLVGRTSHDEVARRLRRRLLRHLREVEGAGPAIEPAAPKASGQFTVSAEELAGL